MTPITGTTAEGATWLGTVTAVDPEARTITIHDPRWFFLPAEGVRVATSIEYASPYLSLVENE